MDNNDIKKNNFLNVEQSNKKNIRRRSSIKRRNIGKIIKNSSLNNSNNKDDELITNIPKLKKNTEIRSKMKSIFPLSKKFTILIIIIILFYHFLEH